MGLSKYKVVSTSMGGSKVIIRKVAVFITLACRFLYLEAHGT